MKAISIHEPWVTMIAQGKKTIEVRSWQTKYRGQLIICGTRKFNGPYSGKAACIVELVTCRPLLYTDRKKTMAKHINNAFAWEIRLLKRLKPFPVRGQLGLFKVRLPKSALKSL